MFIQVKGQRVNADRIAFYHKQKGAANVVVIQFSGFPGDCTVVRLKTGKEADMLMEALDHTLAVNPV